MTRAKRDVNVELLRIPGARMVIGTHIKPPTTVKGALVPARVWISCLVGDGVAIFRMILGFFCFGQTDAKKRLSRQLCGTEPGTVAYTAIYVAVIFIISLALAELCALPRRLLGCAGRR